MTFPRTFRDRRHSRGAFTLIELLTVITIILVLVGLVIGAAGYANTKAARSRTEGEIRALGTIMENYKSDNGTYPRSTETDKLDARTQGAPANYASASRDLYALLTGQVNATTGVPDTSPTYPRATTAIGSNYWGELKPNMLVVANDGTNKVSAINDPYGFSYGYATAYQADLDATPPVNPPKRGYNPTFDLWSVANTPTPSTKNPTKVTDDNPSSPDTTIRPVWIKNW